MDFQLSELQRMLRQDVRNVLEREYPLSHVKELDQRGEDYDRDFYLLMAKLGWLGFLLPRDYGGVEGEWLDCAVFYEECGRALIRSPHFATVVLGGQLILNFGSERQKSNLLPKVTSGELILAPAISEPDSDLELRGLATSATLRDNTYSLTGSKLFVPNAHVADYIITGAKLGEDFGLFLVPSKANGVKSTPMDALGGEKLCEVLYEDVQLPEVELLGEKPVEIEQVNSLQNRTKLMLCAEMVGACDKVLEMTVDYCKQRIIFDRPIGAFQSPQHLMVDMTIAISGLRWLVYHTVWMAGLGMPCDKEVYMAQLQAGQTYTWVTRNAIHINGTVSLSTEHNLSLFYMKSKASQLNLGSADEMKEHIGSKIEL